MSEMNQRGEDCDCGSSAEHERLPGVCTPPAEGATEHRLAALEFAVRRLEKQVWGERETPLVAGSFAGVVCVECAQPAGYAGPRGMVCYSCLPASAKCVPPHTKPGSEPFRAAYDKGFCTAVYTDIARFAAKKAQERAVRTPPTTPDSQVVGRGLEMVGLDAQLPPMSATKQWVESGTAAESVRRAKSDTSVPPPLTEERKDAWVAHRAVPDAMGQHPSVKPCLCGHPGVEPHDCAPGRGEAKTSTAANMLEDALTHIRKARGLVAGAKALTDRCQGTYASVVGGLEDEESNVLELLRDVGDEKRKTSTERAKCGHVAALDGSDCPVCKMENPAGLQGLTSSMRRAIKDSATVMVAHGQCPPGERITCPLCWRGSE